MAALTEHELSYYSTVAQVAPVLLIALALELRFSSLVSSPRRPWQRTALLWGSAIVVLLLVACELLAVLALEGGSASGQTSAWTKVGVVVGVIVVFVAALARVREDVDRHAVPPARSSAEPE